VSRHALNLHDELHVFACRQNRNQIECLEYKADLVQSELCECPFAQVIDALASDPYFAFVRPVESTDRIQQRCLAAT
jgi:hypothetical protein